MKKTMYALVLMMFTLSVFFSSLVFAVSPPSGDLPSDPSWSLPELPSIGLRLSNTTITENSPIGTVVWEFSYSTGAQIIEGSYSLDDSWDEALDNEKFVINKNTLTLKFIPDYENPIDVWDTPANNTYVIRVKFKTKIWWGQGEIPGISGKEVFRNFIIKVLDQDDYHGIVITLLGDNPQIVTQGTVYVDPGATAVDSAWNDISTEITSDADAVVDTSSVGSYIVTYSIVEWDGNRTSKTRTVEVVAAWSGWGWSGWGGIVKDNCPNGDHSPSYYDGTCKAQTEIEQAYHWAFEKGITTMPTIERARMYDGVLRAELAKMISVYATQVLNKTGVTELMPYYEDVWNIQGDLKGYIVLSYQLGLMGRKADGSPLKNFDPYGQVTRAQFATVLSRLLYGDQYENPGGLRYANHLQVLKDNNILKNTTPTMKELRGYIMLMLMRTEK